MKKYEIIKNGLDDYTLKYKDKEFNFHSDIETMKDMQSVYVKAKEKMLFRLVEQGRSIKEFSKEEKKDGKTYIDNSNKNELEQLYINLETINFMDDICKKQFGMGYLDLMNDIGLEGEEETDQFSTDLIAILSGKTPSQGKKDK